MLRRSLLLLCLMHREACGLILRAPNSICVTVSRLHDDTLPTMAYRSRRQPSRPAPSATEMRLPQNSGQFLKASIFQLETPLQRVHEIGLARLHGRRRWYKELAKTGVSPAVRLGLRLPPKPQPYLMSPLPPPTCSHSLRPQRPALRASPSQQAAQQSMSDELRHQLEAERAIEVRLRALIQIRAGNGKSKVS